MNVPFTLELNVKEINIDESTDPLNLTEYSINLTLNHTIADIKEAIWLKSPDYLLQPSRLQIEYKGVPISDSETLSSGLQLQQPPETSLKNDLTLVINYQDIESSTRIHPPDPLFDIITIWKDDKNQTHEFFLRENLKCTIRTMKDYLVEEVQRRLQTTITRNRISLRLMPSYTLIPNDDSPLSEVLKLDVVPLDTVEFKAELLSTSTRRRFRVFIESEEPALQNERRMVEVDNNTKIHDLKHLLIARIDHGRVTRTFFDQIGLSYNNEKLANNPDINNRTILSALNISNEQLEQANDIIRIKLTVSPHINGIGGILSREFWREITQGNFEFLPNSTDLHSASTNSANSLPTTAASLPNEAIEQGSSHLLESAIETVQTTQNPPDITAIEPFKIVTQDGEVWRLTGDHYETLKEESSGRQQLAKMDDLSDTTYEIDISIDAQVKTICLNSSQCIIVDNGEHHPYLLLNSSGLARLKSGLPDGNILQKVLIERYNKSNTNPIPTPTQLEHVVQGPPPAQIVHPEEDEEEGMHAPLEPQPEEPQIADSVFVRLIEGWKQVLSFSIKMAIALYMMGIKPSKHLSKYWQIYALVLFVGYSLYIVFFTGRNRLQRHWFPDPEFDQIERELEREAEVLRRVSIVGLIIGWGELVVDFFVRLGVERTRDYQLILGERNWFLQNLEHLFKDALLCVMTLVPALQQRIDVHLQQWRSGELEALDMKAFEFWTKFLSEFGNTCFCMANVSPLMMEIRFDNVEFLFKDLDNLNNPAISTTLKAERKYRFLVEYLKLIKLMDSTFRELVASQKKCPDEFVSQMQTKLQELSRELLKVPEEVDESADDDERDAPPQEEVNQE
ncbi:uncharacterized protein J8A68_002662 [[Candida] subhashii]|uniref:Ubiquitin-like domain-containing protein n=1 Tax=[Candida] subhashii TaxID=561895 RepID=A0A8J5QR83_9ASCO|nr:uncharacterized protein J8A68_002662 [[Candida] subhashii]KAG7663802.1 hypothetical protein J8A68_002662 [[Candida] subhashii]